MHYYLHFKDKKIEIQGKYTVWGHKESVPAVSLQNTGTWTAPQHH